MNEDNNSTQTAEPSAPSQAISSNDGAVAAQLNPLVGASTAPAIAKSWHDELPEDLRSDETLKRFKSPAELGKSYVEARRKFGNPEKLMTIPEKEDVKGWNDVYDKLGRPKESKEYEFASVDGIEFDKNQIPKYQESFHKRGLTKEQAAGVTQDHIQILKQYSEEATQQEKASQQAELTKMQAEIGENLSIFNNVVERTFNSLNEKMGGKLIEKLESKGLTHDPVILKLIYEVGKMNMEDSLRSGRGPSSMGYNSADAAAKINQLQGDPAFREKMLNGDPQAKAEFAQLFKTAFPNKVNYSSI